MHANNVVNKVSRAYIVFMSCTLTIADCQSFLKNKMADLLAHLIQVQLDEANTTIGKLSRMVNLFAIAIYTCI